jgi:hypothetical protein
MTAEFWEYDTRLGRRWNLDPVDQISISNYVAFRNNPIFYIDPNGDEPTPNGKPIEKEKAPSWLVADNKFKTTVFGDGSGDVVVSAPRNRIASETNTASNLPREANGNYYSDADALNNFALGFTPAGIALDLYTLKTGKEYGSNTEVNGLWRYAGVLPFVSEFRKVAQSRKFKELHRIEDIQVLNQGDPSKVFVIGRSMNERVIPYAQAIGAKYYIPKYKVATANSLKNNIRMIQRKLNQGWTIIDIGLDPANPQFSEYYEAEMKEVLKFLEKTGGKLE